MPSFTPDTEPIDIGNGRMLNIPNLSGTYTPLDKYNNTQSPDRFDEIDLEEICAQAGLTLESNIAIDFDSGSTSSGTLEISSSAESSVIEPRRLTISGAETDEKLAFLFTNAQGDASWLLPGESDSGLLSSFALKGSGHRMRGFTVSGESITLDAIRLLEGGNNAYEFLAYNDKKFEGDINWEDLKTGRSLLLIHGTFSSTKGSFKEFYENEEFGEWVKKEYGDRVFAFDHPTLHHSVEENVANFFAMMPSLDQPLEIDFIGQSRGGLIGRLLVKSQDTEKRLKIRRGVFVGTPNRGTQLAKQENWRHLFNQISSVSKLVLKGPTPSFFMDFFMSIPRMFVQEVIPELPGLLSMVPNESFQLVFDYKGDHQAEYYAITADSRNLFEEILDHVIHGEENDTVVPTFGVYDVGVSAKGFPIPEAHRLTHVKGVTHLSYYDDKNEIDTAATISKWLSA